MDPNELNWGAPPPPPPAEERYFEADEKLMYEGCGLEGPLIGAFFSQFDPTQGPVIRCQVMSLLVGIIISLVNTANIVFHISKRIKSVHV